MFVMEGIIWTSHDRKMNPYQKIDEVISLWIIRNY
jgi:hypothetical protein